MIQVDEPPRYPALLLLIKWGSAFIALVAALPVAAAVLAWVAGASAWWLLAGLATSPITGLIAATYVEMARIVSDTLMPR